VARLRAALVGLVGVDGRAELEQLEAYTRALLPATDADKAVMIDAIHALLTTLAWHSAAPVLPPDSETP
jgi:hypothetical protein